MSAISGLFKNELKRSAACYLYIFVNPKASVHPIVLQKRAQQLANLNKFVKNRALFYDGEDIARIVWDGICERYGQTPYQLLDAVYKGATRTAIGAEPGDTQYIENLNPVTVTVKDTQTGTTEKKSLWEDVKKVIEWLSDIILKFFGGAPASQVSTYSPNTGDWPSGGYDTKKSSFGGSSTLLLLGAGFMLWRNKDLFKGGDLSKTQRKKK